VTSTTGAAFGSVVRLAFDGELEGATKAEARAAAVVIAVRLDALERRDRERLGAAQAALAHRRAPIAVKRCADAGEPEDRDEQDDEERRAEAAAAAPTGDERRPVLEAERPVPSLDD
jgi:hypothetical protein